MSLLTVDVAVADFEAAGCSPTPAGKDHPGLWNALCPVCLRECAIGEHDGEVVIECSQECSRERIADELHFRREQRGTLGDSPIGEQADDWLEGAPMDPEAVGAEPLPTIPGFPYLHRGAGAVVVGPTGGGRSSLVQACAYDAAPQAIRVAYLGSEVTEREFNARAADLVSRRGDNLDDDLRAQLSRVRYLNLASTIARAWQDPEHWTDEIAARFDVVAIDPLSTVASTLDLDFDKSNAEFVRFYDRLVQPLAEAGVAVVMLDNIGHAIDARSRAKGASAKADRADLTFSCKLRAQPVGLILMAHKVRSVRAPFRRGDTWTFDRDTQRIERGDGEHQDHQHHEATFRPTVLMERVSRAIEADPGLTRRALRSAVKGKHDAKELALELLIAEGYVDQHSDEKWPTHFSTRAFRAPSVSPDTDGENGTGPQVAPDWPPGPEGTTGPLAPSLKGQGEGPPPTDPLHWPPTTSTAPSAYLATTPTSTRPHEGPGLDL